MLENVLPTTAHNQTRVVPFEPVRAVLTRKGMDVWGIAPSATVFEAIALMDQRRVGALVVLSGAELAGIISERDYARKVILKGRSSKETLVSDIMTKDVITVSLEESVETCLRIMTNNRIRHLPVVDADELVGLVSIGDLVRSIISAQAAVLDHLNNYIAGNYPA